MPFEAIVNKWHLLLNFWLFFFFTKLESLTLFCASTTESRTKILYQWNAFKHPSGLDCCPFKGGGPVVVDSLLIVTSIVGFCNCSMFCGALICVHSSFAIILMGKRELVTLLCLSPCGSSSRYQWFVCSLWLWYFLIILNIFGRNDP